MPQETLPQDHQPSQKTEVSTVEAKKVDAPKSTLAGDLQKILNDLNERLDYLKELQKNKDRATTEVSNPVSTLEPTSARSAASPQQIETTTDETTQVFKVQPVQDTQLLQPVMPKVNIINETIVDNDITQAAPAITFKEEATQPTPVVQLTQKSSVAAIENISPSPESIRISNIIDDALNTTESQQRENKIEHFSDIIRRAHIEAVINFMLLRNIIVNQLNAQDGKYRNPSDLSPYDKFRVKKKMEALFKKDGSLQIQTSELVAPELSTAQVQKIITTLRPTRTVVG